MTIAHLFRSFRFFAPICGWAMGFVLFITGALASADEWDVVGHIDLGSNFSAVVRKKNVGELEWTDDRIAHLKHLIHIVESKAPGFLRNVLANGFSKFELTRDLGGPVAVTSASDHVIYLSLLLYKLDFLYENIGPFSRSDIAIIHELAHAFDVSNRFSDAPEFLGMIPHVPEQDLITQKSLTRVTIQNEKDFFQGLKKAEILNRRFANSKGFPSLYAIEGAPGNSAAVESFAEFCAYIIADPEAPSYISSEIIAWFQKNVLN